MLEPHKNCHMLLTIGKGTVTVVEDVEPGRRSKPTIERLRKLCK